MRNGNKTTVFLSREEKPTRCHCMLYCIYDTLNMFRALLCPSSGALDYTFVIAAYGVQCLAAGCRGSRAGQKGVNPGRGMLPKCNIPLPWRTTCCPYALCKFEKVGLRQKHNWLCVEKKNQLDLTVCFIALRICSTCLGTSMPIIRSSRQYVCYCRVWCAVLGCWLSGVWCRAAGCASRKRDVARSATSLFLEAHPAALMLYANWRRLSYVKNTTDFA